MGKEKTKQVQDSESTHTEPLDIRFITFMSPNASDETPTTSRISVSRASVSESNVKRPVEGQISFSGTCGTFLAQEEGHGRRPSTPETSTDCHRTDAGKTLSEKQSISATIGLSLIPQEEMVPDDIPELTMIDLGRRCSIFYLGTGERGEPLSPSVLAGSATETSIKCSLSRKLCAIV